MSTLSTFSTEVDRVPAVEGTYGHLLPPHDIQALDEYSNSKKQSDYQKTSSASTHSSLHAHHHSPRVDKVKLSPSCRISSARITRVNSINKVTGGQQQQNRRNQPNVHQRASPRRCLQVHPRESSSPKQSLCLQTSQQRESPSSVRASGRSLTSNGPPRPLFSQQSEPHLAPICSSRGLLITEVGTINSRRSRADDSGLSTAEFLYNGVQHQSPRIEDRRLLRRTSSSTARRPHLPTCKSEVTCLRPGGSSVPASPSLQRRPQPQHPPPPPNLIVSYELTSNSSTTSTSSNTDSFQFTSDLSPESSDSEEDEHFGSLTATCGARGPALYDYGLFVLFRL